MIIKPQHISSLLKFASGIGTHEVSALVLSHLYGAAEKKAKTLDLSDSTIAVYDLFRDEIARHLNIEKAALPEEVVFFLVSQLNEKLDELKKTCIVPDDSASS